MNNAKKKLLIYIITPTSTDHVTHIFSRIDPLLITKYNCEVLIIENMAHDIELREQYVLLANNAPLNITILFNPIRQEYGGLQKLGFEYAIQNNFDAIVLLHGLEVYAPECIELLVSPIFNEGVDLVLGSRVGNKSIGNKVLSAFQSRMLKQSITDFHSGFRAYSVAALSSIPFKRNSNQWVFDSQIYIQLSLAGKTITEGAVPRFSVESVCHSNAFCYGMRGIRATLSSKLHQLSIFYRREYDILDPSEDYSLKLGYRSSHTLAIDNVEQNSYVLDIGGGQGRIATQLKAKSCFVTGIDRCDLKEESNYNVFIQQDLDHLVIDFDFQRNDVILLLDIVEHLSNPEDFFDKLRRASGIKQPKFIITTPNIAFFLIRFQLLFGKFNYGKEGILDKTHQRLFTFKTMKKFCEQCGFEVKKTIGIPAPYPKAVGLNILGKTLLNINRFFIVLNKGLFSYQIYLEVRPTPMVEALLANANDAKNSAHSNPIKNH